ncbi:DsbA family protein [Conexibacter woesei]|uniref:DsbA family protein n=1 Tax=Conexibacter woesei TaxID=191495 RepID=UPI0004200C51|nr:DsbA family protein [Conexibacter woesei]
MPATIHITEYTDPACPWAFSAEPFRYKLEWLYGDAIAWSTRMVGLSEDPEDAVRAGFTPEVLSQALARIADLHGMPIDTSIRERMSASIPACRAVVATRLNAPDRERAVLRALRLRNFRGEPLDADETLAGAASDARVDPADLAAWMADPATQDALDADMAAAREPTAAARVMDARLADWPGGRRYTCPSYELVRASDGLQLSAPGFQPFRVYDVLTANLAPEIERRDKPTDVATVLEWSGEPLATREIAEICEITDEEAHTQLLEVATPDNVGTSAFWTLH